MKCTKAIVYCRVSTSGQAEEGVSIDGQEDRLLGFARVMDIEVVEVIKDAGVSARSLERPGLQRALAMVEEGVANAVLISKLDRLTRSVKDLAHLIEKYFMGDEVALISLGESVDTRTAGGRLVLHVLGSVAEWERSVVAERTREALAHLRRRGVAMGGAPLGKKYGDVVDEHGHRVVERVEEELRVVQRIHELRAAGRSLRAIATTLTTEGVKTKLGGRWHPQSVARVLRRATTTPEPAPACSSTTSPSSRPA